MNIEEKIKEQFDKLLEDAKPIGANSRCVNRLANTYIIESSEFIKWAIQLINFIERIFTKDSTHYKTLNDRWERIKNFASYDIKELQYFNAVLEASYNDYINGFLFDVKDLITAGVFDDFLEMAEYLLAENYKDASAVLIGGVLEDTLRKLCSKNNITFENKPTIEPMNVALVKSGIYNRLVQKQITAWADIRNNSAHGNYKEYSQEDVEDMAKKVRKFITEHLA